MKLSGACVSLNEDAMRISTHWHPGNSFELHFIELQLNYSVRSMH